MTKSTILRDALHETATALREVGLAEPQREARRLIAQACSLAPEEFIARPLQKLDTAQLQRLGEFTKRRCDDEPLSRIVGRREFYGREFELGPTTLDPRPDTETLIEMVLETIDAEGGRESPLRILDIGTGTGALLVTLLAELPNAQGLGTDISEDALAVASRNSVHHGVRGRATFMRTSALDGVSGPFDFLVSNPPYIPTADIESLSGAVRRFDPLAALDGGADGLDIYRMIISGIVDVVPDGWVMFEVGAGQVDSVTDLLMTELSQWKNIQTKTRKDLGGHVRCVAAATHCS